MDDACTRPPSNLWRATASSLTNCERKLREMVSSRLPWMTAAYSPAIAHHGRADWPDRQMSAKSCLAAYRDPPDRPLAFQHRLKILCLSAHLSKAMSMAASREISPTTPGAPRCWRARNLRSDRAFGPFPIKGGGSQWQLLSTDMHLTLPGKQGLGDAINPRPN